MTTLATTLTPGRPDHLFTVEEYLRMVSAGILTKRDKVELLEGRIVEKMPIDPPHVIASELLMDLLRRTCPAPWIVRADSPLQLEDSAPEPDLMVIRGPRENYEEHHPNAQDVALVIEISDSSLRDDRTQMARVYAKSHVATYWILNLKDRQLEVHSNPSSAEEEPAYREKITIPEDGKADLRLPDGKSTQVSIKEMLPRKSAAQ
jgi:Uma2 family endonuclease